MKGRIRSMGRMGVRRIDVSGITEIRIYGDTSVAASSGVTERRRYGITEHSFAGSTNLRNHELMEIFNLYGIR